MIICRICNEREARKGRRKCSQCELHRSDKRAQESVIPARPKLVWTGLLIDNELHELVHPSGKREPLLAFASGPGKYWYEPGRSGRTIDGDGLLFLRVMVEPGNLPRQLPTGTAALRSAS